MTESVSGEKKKVLIVEDHPLFRAMLAQLINNNLGMTVCGEADNIEDAMNIIHQTRPDGAIIDLSLHGSSGLELIKKIKAQKINLPILVLSMHDEAHYAERVLQAGAKGYISKQESPSKVLEAIQAVMNGGIYASERVTASVMERLAGTDKATDASGIGAPSDREMEVFRLVGSGFNSREIAGQLGLEPPAVDSYRARIKAKLGIRNAAEMYHRAAQWMAGQGL